MSPRRSSRARDRPGPPAPRPGRDDPAAAFARAERAREQCAGKQWFQTEGEARALALMHRTRWGEDRVPYACEVCGGWHLASRPAARGG